ncbi:MAG: Calx-beta domain-containing protein, partial [Thermoanaerobaculia bacterium]
VEGRSFVFGRLYSAAGVALGPEFPVSLEPSVPLVVPRVDREADGDFAVVWQEDDPDDSLAAGVVKLRLFASSGASLAGPVEVAGLAEVQDRPDVAFGHDGEIFVVWRQGNGIFGRLYDAAGAPQTDALKLDSGAPQFSSVAENPRVESDAAGRFLAVWSNRVGPAAQNQDIYGRLVDQEGRLLGNEVRITTTPPEGDHQLRPAVAGQPAGFVVIWEDRINKILGQRLGQAAGALRFREAAVRTREGAISVTVFVERGGQAGAVSVSYRTQNGTAVAGEDFVASTGTLQWAEGDSVPKPITVLLINDRIQEEQRETFSIVLENPTGGATVGEPSRVTVTVLDDDGLPTFLGGEIEAAAKDADDGFVADPDVAMDPTAASGRFALVWTDRPLTTLPVVRGRFWLGEGTPLPPIFEIGAGVTPAAIWTPQGLTVVWAGGQGRIEGRRFTEGGSPQGAAFRISDRSEESRRPAIAANPQGGAVVVWEGVDPANRDRFGVDILARRLNAAGQPVGPEFAVGSSRSGLQLNPDVAVAPDGSFVVVWQGRSTRTFTTEIFARRFSREGVALGAEFQVNTATAGEQTRPSVAVDPSGNFFVVWDGVGSDTGIEDVFGQLFDAQGRKIGGEIRV